MMPALRLIFMMNDTETNNFSTAIDKLGSSDFGKAAQKTLLILSFLAPEEIPQDLMRMTLESVSLTEDVDINLEDFQEERTGRFPAEELINYRKSSESFTMPLAIRKIVQDRYSFEKRKENLHQTYFMLKEFFSFYEEEFGGNRDLYIRHASHALKHAEPYRVACEHSAALAFNVGYDAVQNERYDEAAVFFKRAVVMAENEFEISNTVADYKSHFAGVCELREKYGEAIGFFRQALDLCKQVYERESPEYAAA